MVKFLDLNLPFLHVFVFAAVATGSASYEYNTSTNAKEELIFYVGGANYSTVPSQTTHINAFALSTFSDELKPHYRSLAVGPNPSWLAYDGHSKIYAGLESTDSSDIGGVASLAFNRFTGAKLINAEPWPGPKHYGPAHCAVDSIGKFVLAASYSLGQLGIFPVELHGAISAPTIVQYGSGSKAHMVAFSPNEKFIYVPDLGLDCIHYYHWDGRAGSATAAGKIHFQVGTHPRHMVFSKSGDFAFLLTESTNQLILFTANPSTGDLQELSRENTVPESDLNTSFAAEVVMHPSQKFVFVSNRGSADSVAIFSFSEVEKSIHFIKRETDQISWPRGMELSPNGDYLIVANQQGEYADKINAFSVDIIRTNDHDHDHDESNPGKTRESISLKRIAQATMPAPTTIVFV